MRDKKTLMKSYIASYDFLCGFVQRARFAENPELVVVSLHMVYGWMPTALDLVKHDKGANSLSPDKLREIGEILDRAKDAKSFEEIFLNEENRDSDFRKLKTFINNSVVGASKVLHFCNPNVFAIFDSKICNLLFPKEFATKNANHRPTIKEYRSYLKGIHRLVQDLNKPKLNNIFSPDYQSSISLIRQVESKIFEIASSKNGDLSSIRNYFKK